MIGGCHWGSELQCPAPDRADHVVVDVHGSLKSVTCDKQTVPFKFARCMLLATFAVRWSHRFCSVCALRVGREHCAFTGVLWVCREPAASQGCTHCSFLSVQAFFAVDTSEKRPRLCLHGGARMKAAYSRRFFRRGVCHERSASSAVSGKLRLSGEAQRPFFTSGPTLLSRSRSFAHSRCPWPRFCVAFSLVLWRVFGHGALGTSSPGWRLLGGLWRGLGGGALGPWTLGATVLVLCCFAPCAVAGAGCVRGSVSGVVSPGLGVALADVV